MEMKNKVEPKTTYRLFLIMGMSTAILLVSPVLVLFGIGYIIDSIFHTHPFYTLIGGTVGFISGMFNVFKMTKMIQKRKKTNNSGK